MNLNKWAKIFEGIYNDLLRGIMICLMNFVRVFLVLRDHYCALYALKKPNLNLGHCHLGSK